MKNTKSLKKAFDFRKTLNYGKFSKGKYVAVYALKRKKTENCEENLFGICVSKKHGNSVTRNKLKRWAREAYTSYENSLKKGYLVIVLYKKDIREDYDNGKISYELISKDIEKCFEEIGLKEGKDTK